MPRIPLFRSLLLASLLLCYVASSSADTLKITSTPPGATVELDGITLGATPFEKDFPGGYFHRTHTALGQRLEHPMFARLSLPGYATREIALTVGPMNWIDLHGHNHGEYWLIKSDHFHADLELISATFTGIGFALSSTDLLTVLHRFYPDIPAATVRASSDVPTDSAEPAAAATQLVESSTPPASSPVSYAPPEYPQIPWPPRLLPHPLAPQIQQAQPQSALRSFTDPLTINHRRGYSPLHCPHSSPVLASPR